MSDGLINTPAHASEEKQDNIITALDAAPGEGGLATEDKQDSAITELQDIETDVEAVLGATSLIKQSEGGGAQKLTIPGTPFQVAGSDRACRSVLVVHSSDNVVYMNIGAVADVDDFPIPKNVVIPIPVNNCSDLNFFGTEADTVHLLWRD